jgi:hypothetical protein
MISKDKLKEWGADEAREHKTSLKKGIATALQHIHLYGPDYYPRLERLEARLKKR